MSLENIVDIIKEYGSLEKTLDCLSDDQRVILLDDVKDYISLCRFFKEAYIIYNPISKLLRAYYNENGIGAYDVKFAESEVKIAYFNQKPKVR